MQDWILVTGFGPFPGVPHNPTAAIAEALDGAAVAGRRVAGRVLDTSWERSAAALLRHLESADGLPALAVHFGVAACADRIRIERQAANRCAPRADADGALPPADRLDPARDRDQACPTSLPVDAIAAAVTAAGLPARTSDDCGDYVCNRLYWASLDALAHRGVPCVFVHVPMSSADQAAMTGRRVVEVIVQMGGIG